MLKRAALLSISLLIIGAAISLSSSRGKLQPALDWPQLPEHIKLGQVTGVATDAADRVCIFHRGKHPIVVLDASGRFIKSWGDGLVKTAHGLRIDREGNILPSPRSTGGRKAAARLLDYRSGLSHRAEIQP